MPPENKKESSYPKEWLKKGDEDMAAAEALLTVGRTGPASFHIQQALEKCLKGYLLSKGWKLRRIHDLEELLEDAIKFNNEFKIFSTICRTASEYYIEERYPFDIASKLTKDELDIVLKQAKIFISQLSEGI